MTTISSVTLETPDPETAEAFYAELGVADRIRVREGDAPTSGFRGFTLSILASQPANVRAFHEAALAAGATQVTPVKSSLWGVGGLIQAPDGAIWNIATSTKKDAGPATRTVDAVVLLLGVDDVKASRTFYTEHGFAVNKSFGSYVDFQPSGRVNLGLYKRKALAKSADVDPAGTGSHRLSVQSDAGAFTDPDGFVWE
jgi:predicted lactoylglutathione lyase